MMKFTELVHEQFLEYSNQLKEVEKIIIEKYKNGEDYTEDLMKANGLKMLKREASIMMTEKLKL